MAAAIDRNHTPGTDLIAIADRIRERRERMSDDAIAFSMMLYFHESIDVEAALRRAAVIEKVERD